MHTEVGVWIDHKKAIVATIAGRQESIRQIASNSVRRGGTGGAQDRTPEDQRDRRYIGHLNKYYDEVIASLQAADALLILGPGEAKLELKRRLEHEGFRGQLVGVEAADKLTEPQVAARVRRFFLNSPRKLQELVAPAEAEPR